MRRKIEKLQRGIGVQVARHHIKIKFLIVGVWNTIFGYLAYYFFESILSGMVGVGAHSYMPAIVLSNSVAILMAYSLHRKITFQSSAQGWMRVKEFGRFAFSNSITVGLSFILLPVFVEFLKLGPKIAGLAVTLLCTVVSYFAHSRITFKNCAG